ncbi:MAG: helix-turn-helix domain-containing protein [Saprospiraceae bacterium]|nr:helix-turn-helix domain-containing protein [Candidatus Defluviibacterium haderslevense]MBK7243796.1 helix-turn-helix domain-containing protein [Candidatus Defluviibacterium haderslevense]
MNKKLLNLDDVALYLNCSKSTMYRYVREGRISYIRRGRRLLFRETDIEVFLDNHRISIH